MLPAARALKAVFRGAEAMKEDLTVDEEVGFLMIANAIRRLCRS